MYRTLSMLIVFTLTLAAQAQDVKRDIPYASPAAERQVLDIYAPPGAKNLPVVFWIHGGGWQTGDKSSVQDKPQAFVEQGVRLRLHQLPPAAERGHGDDHSRCRQVDGLGPRSTSPSTAAIRSASSSWAIPPERSSPRWSAPTIAI